MIREVANFDPARVEVVLDWGLRDVLLAYVAILKERERTKYYVDLLLWAMLAPYVKRKERPPQLPKILKGV
jgi:hypothetical protein